MVKQKATEEDKVTQLLTDYFANKENDDLLDGFEEKIEQYGDYIRSLGFEDDWRYNYSVYYGLQEPNGVQPSGPPGTYRIKKCGEQGELAYINVPHVHNLGRHLLNLITDQRPQPDVIATNKDQRSIDQARLGEVALENYNPQIDRCSLVQVEFGLIFGTGYLSYPWDPNFGEEIVSPLGDNEIKYKGDFRFATHTPMDVVIDPSILNWEEQKWVFVRRFENKYDLMAIYPDHADEINAAPSMKKDISSKLPFFQSIQGKDSDVIAVWDFYHIATPARPKGRFVRFIDHAKLVDIDMPYKKIPVERLAPEELYGTPFGRSPLFDLTSMQEAYNICISSWLTNEKTFAIQHVAVAKGGEDYKSSMEGGLHIIEYDPQGPPPQGINLTANSPTTSALASTLEKLMETCSGINTVQRGNPDKGMSGAAMALIQTLAMQYSNQLQRSRATCLENTWNGMIEILKCFANDERMVTVFGESEQAVKTFTGKDLEGIVRVRAIMGNPIMRTTAGALEVAKEYAQQGWLKDPEDFLTVMDSGRLEPIKENIEEENRNVRTENEKLIRGMCPNGIPADQILQQQQTSDRPPATGAFKYDNHNKHWNDHRMALMSPEARNNKETVIVTTAHMDEHLSLWAQLMPDELQAMGLPPLAMPAGPMPPMPAINPAASKPASQAITAQPESEATVQGMITKGPKKPRLPTNPMTGQQVAL